MIAGASMIQGDARQVTRDRRASLTSTVRTAHLPVWHLRHSLPVGAVVSFLCCVAASWHVLQLRWYASSFVSTVGSVSPSYVTSGIASPNLGFSPSCAWHSRQPRTTGFFASFIVSAVSVVVRSAGSAVLSGGCFAASAAGWSVWWHSTQPMVLLPSML